MQQFTCTLSIEEFAVAVAAVEKPAESSGILKSTFGEISAEETRGRFSAAQHALLARGLLKLENEKAVLNSSLAAAVNGIFACTEFFRASKTSPNGWEDILSTLHTPAGWLEQFTHDKFICQLRIPIEMADVKTRFVRFYSPVFDKGMKGQTVKLPDNFLGFNIEQRRDKRFLYDQLMLLSKNSFASENFASEMANAIWRGTLMRLQPTGESTLFLIQGPRTLWEITAQSKVKDQIDLYAQAIDEPEFLKNMPIPA